MKFTEMKYVRPDIESYKGKFHILFEKFEKAEKLEEQNQLINEINILRNEIETMFTLVNVRHLIDITDKFYEDEQVYIDKIMPIYEGIISKYYSVLVNSKFRGELEEKWGKQLFNIAEVQLKTFSPEIIEDLQEEYKLITKYTKLMASVKVMFEGEKINLEQLNSLQQSNDRVERKKAWEAKTNFFIEHEKEIDEIFDKLVKVRTRISRKLGYNNFVELGYARLARTDYNAEMVANFRRQVRDFIVPIATKLRERQAKRLGLDKLKYYDEKFSFKTGNAKPHGDAKWILNNIIKMYNELSEETKEFFSFMTKNELMDLVSRKGKVDYAFSTFISKYKSPFIVSSFNGTARDIQALTHEGGHAFQSYISRKKELSEYSRPTLEACEIHSMSMEFLTWPWINLFFKQDTDKFKFTHLSESLLLIPYVVAVDEFQHFVYENPDVTPEERKNTWRKIEKKYLPYRDYEDNNFLEKGCSWFEQSNIFDIPFYFIDYALAKICAFQFWKKSQQNKEQVWKDYVRLCKAGGSKSFVELVNEANLILPFQDGCIESVIGSIENWLNSVDDTKL